MSAAILQMMSIVAFSIAGVFCVISFIIFFRLKIPAVINDLTGKAAERRIQEFREQNRQAADYAYDMGSYRRLETVEPFEESTIPLASETDFLEERTELLEKTELLGKTGILLENTVEDSGFWFLYDEIIVHTEEVLR